VDIRAIKNDKYFFWTNHSKYKMAQYGLSPTSVKNIIRRPERKEVGIAPETIAVMKRKDSKRMKKECWVMIQKSAKRKTQSAKLNNAKVKIISAWIYPGVSPKGKDIYIPEDVMIEIENLK
jgi:hypothetical protein